MGEDRMRVGLVDLDAGLTRRLIRSAELNRVEACDDPVCFATDSTTDYEWDRLLAISLDTATIDWELIDKLQQWASTCPLLGIATTSDVPLQIRGIARGLAGVIQRDAGPSRILRAAQAVLDGDSVLPAFTLAELAGLLPASDMATDAFTQDERSWLVQLADGRTIQQIAASSSWSDRQIRRLLTGLYLRMGVTNRDQAVALAGRMGLVG